MKIRTGKNRRFTFKKFPIAMIAFFATLLIASIIGAAYLIRNIRQYLTNQKSYGKRCDVTCA